MKKILKQMNQGLVAVALLACATHLYAQAQDTHVQDTQVQYTKVQTAGPTPQVERANSASSTQPPAGKAQNVLANSNTVVESPVASTPISSSPINSTPAHVSKPNTASQLANLLGGLILILILIFGLSWFVKRFSQGGLMQNPVFKVVGSMPLGTRERLMLVSVGDKQILLGVTATQISNLHVFDYPVASVDKEPASDFSQKLMAILQQKNISQSGNSSPRDRQA